MHNKMKQISILVLLATAVVSAKINILTSIIINELPYSQTLSCTDCTPPVVYEEDGLPDFMELNDNVISVVETPNPGQYHVSISMRDAEGQEAHIFVIIIITDELGSQSTAGTRNVNISLTSSQSSNFTSLLLTTYSNLTEREIQIQRTLDQQSQLNQKIAAYLILIRRYTSTIEAHELKLSDLSAELQALLPSQSGLNQEIILNQNKLERNKQAIMQLLASIQEMRKMVNEKRQEQKTASDEIQDLNNQVHLKLVEKSVLQSSLEVRRQIFNEQANNQSARNCNYNAIEYQQELLTQSSSNRSTLEENINSADQEIAAADQTIQDLKRQLEEAEQDRFNSLMRKYEYEAQLRYLDRQRNSSLTIIQTLQVQCETNNTVNGNNNQELEQAIQVMEQRILEIEQMLENDLYIRIEQLQNEVAELVSDIDFLNSAIDQSIMQVSNFYTQNEQIERRLIQLKERKVTIDALIAELQAQISLLINSTDQNNKQLEQAKLLLAEALKEKEENDKAVQKIFIDNLDIIRAINGNGGYRFDISRLTNITGISIDEINIQVLYQLIIPDVPNSYSCQSSVSFYGIGEIESVNEQTNIITIRSASGTLIELVFPECSINLSSQQNHSLRVGDAICWKGYRADSLWVITQSIVFPGLE